MIGGDFRSGCPIASTLDLVGDRWTLVLLRDLMNGKARFKEFLESPERISSNILSARLVAMEDAGLIESRLYQRRPKRREYKLTRSGAGLLPVLQAICCWGEAELPDRWPAPATFMTRTPEDLMKK
ncbi:MAG TPA: transcriptional regulator [Parvularcula sp.]|nr:transcriptional regulator [Parvularcula sp.]HBS32750.1 transcriptional regulator [Parvularcula sp.]